MSEHPPRESKSDPPEEYEPPVVEDLPVEEPAATSAGGVPVQDVDT
jgi:hypothetical protein